MVARFSSTVQAGPWALSLLYHRHRVSFPGVKRPGSADQPPHLAPTSLGWQQSRLCFSKCFSPVSLCLFHSYCFLNRSLRLSNFLRLIQILKNQFQIIFIASLLAPLTTVSLSMIHSKKYTITWSAHIISSLDMALLSKILLTNEIDVVLKIIHVYTFQRFWGERVLP